ncbi:MAG: WD40 repeat domain-containing protein [Leptolyngbyaceae cyanobacterium RU_5_1]|nr:WD40 repeat domain-containing protein [Leptolyngbyaceae cyanobacterium RU_5_1]
MALSYEDFSKKMRSRLDAFPEITYYLQTLVYGNDFTSQGYTFLEGHQGGVYDVTFNKDGNFLASASRDETVRFWRKTGDFSFQPIESSSLKFNSYVWTVRFSQYGIVTGDAGGCINFWNEEDLLAGKEPGLIKSLTIGSPNNPVFRISFDPTRNYIAASTLNEEVQLWKITLSLSRQGGKIVAPVKDIETGEQKRFSHGGEVYDVNFNPLSSSSYFVSAGMGNVVKYWDAELDSNQTPREFVPESSAKDLIVYKTSFSYPDSSGSAENQMLASANSDGTISVWRISTGELLQTLTHSFNKTAVYSSGRKAVFGVAFSPDNRILASTGDDRTVKLWSVHDWKQLRTYWHRDALNRLSFGPDGKLLASASADGSVWLYQIDAIWDNGDDVVIEQLLRDSYHFLNPEGA